MTDPHMITLGIGPTMDTNVTPFLLVGLNVDYHVTAVRALEIKRDISGMDVDIRGDTTAIDRALALEVDARAVATEIKRSRALKVENG
jgi:hypothetical protein